MRSSVCNGQLDGAPLRLSCTAREPQIPHGEAAALKGMVGAGVEDPRVQFNLPHVAFSGYPHDVVEKLAPHTERPEPWMDPDLLNLVPPPVVAEHVFRTAVLHNERVSRRTTPDLCHPCLRNTGRKGIREPLRETIDVCSLEHVGPLAEVQFLYERAQRCQNGRIACDCSSDRYLD
jgi:hypothetical protein